MALAQVRQFVGQNRGKLLLTLGIQEQAAINADDIAGDRKGIDVGAVDDRQREVAATQRCRGYEAINDRVQVVLDQGIGDLRGGSPDGCHHLTPDICFLALRDKPTTGATNGRECAIRRLCRGLADRQ